MANKAAKKTAKKLVDQASDATASRAYSCRVHTWQGVDFVVYELPLCSQRGDTLRLLLPIDRPELTVASVDPIIGQAWRGVEDVAAINLPLVPAYPYTVVVIDQERFLDMVSVRESYRGFAVLRDARVFDPDASDGIVFGTRYLKVLQAAEAAEQQWSLRRGMVHELLHSRKQPFSGMDRPLLEYALVEVGGRVLTGFQAHMPASTDYIVRLDESSCLRWMRFGRMYPWALRHLRAA